MKKTTESNLREIARSEMISTMGGCPGTCPEHDGCKCLCPFGNEYGTRGCSDETTPLAIRRKPIKKG